MSKKKKGFSWGFDWARVAGGGLLFVVAGGISAVLYFGGGMISIWLIVLTGAGFLTMASGLIGEEGVL